MRPGTRNRRAVLAGALLILCFPFLTLGGIRLYLAFHPKARFGFTEGPPRTLEIPARTAAREVAARLEAEGIIPNQWLFLALATLRGTTDTLKAGEYQFTADMGVLDVLVAMEEGRVVLHRVTIPEGATSREIGALLHQEGLADRERFLALVSDPVVASRVDPEATTLEGYLFPDTYYFTKGLREEAIIEKMVARFFRAFPLEEEIRARSLGRSRYEIVTLASIVEREAVTNEEKPLIAAVFHNRLKRKMLLQADPTVLYGRGKPVSSRITYADLKSARNTYNTYIHPGLPPGPIANPGDSSLRAVLYPADVGYLYFVSKNDGTHHFSKSFAEHHRAVRRYQLNNHAGRRAAGG
ncbi:MAG TPA: endolytic transglycosylase MltG [Candidatus Methylomirabilis sp.]|nr:endolytic transglycosylase MltG [Candidatus Methylomirabilis sp.]